MSILQTKCGTVSGLETENCNIFLGIPYATSERFEYSTIVTSWDGIFDATKPGKACPQKITYNEHQEIPLRRFYKREFRENNAFSYDENCLNLNIYTPKAPGKYPVIIFIHGGGFDSGNNNENTFDGTELAKRGIVTVYINYRVGILGYISHKELFEKHGRDGNFGLDDQLCAIKWVKNNIEAFYGNSSNITLMGQSAGAISIQYLCLISKNKNLFQRAIMMSGAGQFPSFGAPQKIEKSHLYWEDFMKEAGVNSIDELKEMKVEKLLVEMDKYCQTHTKNTIYCMPVQDNVLINSPLSNSFKNPLKIDYMIGYTNCDMYAPALAFVEHKFAKRNHAFLYYFDIDAKGDKAKAFHSSDLRFIFNTLSKSWRPYTKDDYEISELMMNYITNFAYSGNPNTPAPLGENFVKPAVSLPKWEKCGSKAIHLREGAPIKMTHTHYLRLLHNFIWNGSQI